LHFFIAEIIETELSISRNPAETNMREIWVITLAGPPRFSLKDQHARCPTLIRIA
jgi:hypothetical protein